MTGIREPRNFLYDDYMDSELFGEAAADFGTPSGGGGRRRGGRLNSGLDMSLESFSAVRRPGGQGRGRAIRAAAIHSNDFSLINNGTHARRFASALGIQPRSHDFGGSGRARIVRELRQQPRVIYRDVPTARVAPVSRVVRRVVDDGSYDFDDGVQEVVEVVQRMRRPQRQIQIIKKVPIQKRVVKKGNLKNRITKVGGGNPNRRFNNAGGQNNRGNINNRVNVNNNRGGNRGTPRIQRNNAIQKKKVIVGGRKPKPVGQPKPSRDQLDRELEEYMRSSKHPRIAL